ncbi:MAG: DUF5069 domain-containing protein [Terrimicrobiaceae bacterium]
MSYPRSPYDTVGGVVYFGRMVDKIRLKAAGTLHPDLQANLGAGFDKRCVDFLRVSYDELVKKAGEGLDDEALLEWGFATGRRPDDEEILIWNEFMRKRGWDDEATEILIKRKKESGFENRGEIQTMFGYIDADEGRPVQSGMA